MTTEFLKPQGTESQLINVVIKGKGMQVFYRERSNGGQMGDMLAWYAMNPGSLQDHYNDSPLLFDLKWSMVLKAVEMLIKGHLKTRSN